MTACLRATALFFALTVFVVMQLPAGSRAEAQETAGERAVIDIIQIRNRDPLRVLDTVHAALDPRGRMGLIDDKLVIATTAANLAELREIIADADSPLRRLIVGVDFAFRADAADSNSQQQSQAIEGESLVFLGVSDEPEAVPRLTVAAEIVSADTALVNVSLANLPGLSGSHIARVPLGTWQLIEPLADTEEANVGSGLQSASPAVAVRIDVVP